MSVTNFQYFISLDFLKLKILNNILKAYYIYIYIYIINQQDATLAVLCLLKTTSMLYMFRTPFASIFRSTINCNKLVFVVSWVGINPV